MKSKPHTAILSLELEVHSLLDSGECSGKPLSPKLLKEYDIDTGYLIAVSGYTLEACLEKLKLKLEALKDE